LHRPYLTFIAGEEGHGPFGTLVLIRVNAALHPALEHLQLEQAGWDTSVLRSGANML
jgi:hypothetical protein